MSRSTLLFLLLLLAGGPLSAQVVIPAPVREYHFTHNLDDSAGGPALQAFGGTVTDGAYVFGANQGLLLADLTLSVTNYTYEFRFKFDTVGGYQRILDFKNRTADTGLYSLGSALNFYPVFTASETDFVAGQFIHVVLTRDGGTGQVAAFVNGQNRFSFADTSELAVFTGPGLERHFFIDDLSVGGEAAAGAVDLIRIFDEPFSSAQVLELFQNGAPAAVPEPATVLLLALALPVLALLHRRRR